MEKDQVIIKKLNDLVTCLICFSRFANPKTLECQHTFCSSCLKDSVDDGKIVCPICQHDNDLKVVRNNRKNELADSLSGLKDEIRERLTEKAGEIRIVIPENVKF